MFKSYVIIALRKLAREKLYVSINIFSLALGIASFLILALYLRSELTYDMHHVNHARIYRVVTNFNNATTAQEQRFAFSQDGIGPLLVKDYPQLGQQVRFRSSTQNVLSYEDNRRKWDRIFLTDPAVFDVFTHKILYGDPKQALATPYSIAISQTFARYYFGDQNPIGKTLSSGAYNYSVTLVFADLPENSHLKYDALLPMSLMDVFLPGFSSNYARTLFGVGIYTYLMVPPDFQRSSFTAITQEFADRYMKTQMTQLKTQFKAELQPLGDLHFGDKLDGDLPTGNIFYVYGFAAVAIFILLIACINYMNLATARATKRAKEVGMRKVLGASKSQLIGQFLGESATFTLLALLVGLALVEIALALTPIGSLMGKEQLLAARSDPSVLLGVLLLSALVAVGSGLYPALYLSAISPLAALTQVKRSWRTGFSMRQVLVLLQIGISIGVIACTLLMTNQMRYVHGKPLGFDKENRLIVTLRGYDVIKNLKTIKDELRREPGVLNALTISAPPGTGHSINLVAVETESGTMEPTGLDRFFVGFNFVDALNVKVVEGRGFSEEIATDAREAVIVNQSFVKKMGWTQPLGKRYQAGPAMARVIGVVEDFHYASLHNAVGALAIQPMSDQFGNVPPNQRALVTASIIVVLSGEQLRSAMDRVQAVIAKFDPKFEFEPVFLEDRLNDLYKSETNLMKLTGIFAGICILISIMGLFGLAAFTTEQRTKEIGVRKVLGASDGQIVGMLSKHLLPLVAIAAVPATLLSYYAIDKWLQRFAYHTDIGWLTFMLATLAVAAVAFATVALQSLKTARGEPVDALRYE
jgi:putative ABC transport system permease protein